MSIITLEVSDDLAARFNAFATSRGLAPVEALEMLLDEMEVDQGAPDTWFENLTSEEQERHLANVDESLAAIDAGRTVPGHVVHQRLREKYGRR